MQKSVLALVAVTASLVLPRVSAQAPPQAPEAPLSFEVASIKPSPPLDPAKIMAGTMHIGMSVDKARVDIGSLSLADLIRTAYKIKTYQLSGPDWISSTRFDVLAKMPEGANEKQVPEMLQALLAERFKLTFHRDKTEQPVYDLVIGKNGSKMKQAEAEPPAPAAGESPAPEQGAPAKGERTFGSGDSQVRIKPNADGKGATVSNKQFGQMKMSMAEGGGMRMEFSRMSMEAMAEMLSRMTDRPVLDKTELKGNYVVALDLSMDEMRAMARAQAAAMGLNIPEGPGRGGDGVRDPAMAASVPSGGSIFTAVQQLGLKLEPRKEPLERIVVDHIEKTPTEN